MSLAFRLSFGASILFIVLVLELCRRGRLREHLALIWLSTGSCMLAFSCSEKPVNLMARALGVEYAPSILLLAGVFVLFCLNLYLTVVVSILRDHTQRLAQELAILKLDHEMGKRSDEPSSRIRSDSGQYRDAGPGPTSLENGPAGFRGTPVG